jgi:hypothetical protein
MVVRFWNHNPLNGILYTNIWKQKPKEQNPKAYYMIKINCHIVEQGVIFKIIFQLIWDKVFSSQNLEIWKIICRTQA